MHNRWFKRAICMRYTSSGKVSQSAWEEKLKALKHRPIKPSQRVSIGFSSVFGYLAPNVLSHELQNFLFVALTIEEKKLQKNKLKRLVSLKIRDYAKREGKEEDKLSKEERLSLRTSAELEMITNIIPDEQYINAFFDTKNNLMFVDVNSQTKVKQLFEWLNKIDNEFEISPYFCASLEVYLTQWLYKPAAHMPAGIHMDNEATLRHNDNSKAVFTHQDLSSDELAALISHDKQVVELALLRDGKLKFKLRSDGSICKLKPTDLLLSEIDRPEKVDSIIQDIEADWIMMANQLTDLFAWFQDIFQVNSNNGDTGKPMSPETPSLSDIEKESVASLDSLSFS